MSGESLELPKIIDVKWVKALYILIGGACAAVLFISTTNYALNDVQHSLANITMQVTNLSDKVVSVTITTGRIEEHLKDIDRRMDIIEGRSHGFVK